MMEEHSKKTLTVPDYIIKFKATDVRVKWPTDSFEIVEWESMSEQHR